MANNTVRLIFLAMAIMLAAVAWSSDEAPQTPEHVTGEQLYPFDTTDPRDEEDEPPIELPDSVAPKLVLLTAEEIEFLESSDDIAS